MKIIKGKNYTLYGGDCLDVLDTLPDNSVDAIVTDPPYGLTSITKRFGKEDSVPAQFGKDGSFSRLSKGFMGKEWDGSGIEYNVEMWRKALRVLKHGGHLLAFGGSRTFHRIACAIEDAGFEIRDTIMWLYGSGFPKSLNIGLAIDKLNGVESKVVGKDRSGVSSHAYQSEETTTAGEYDLKQAQNEWSGWGTALKPAFEPIILARKPINESSIASNVLQWGVGGINIDECRVRDETMFESRAKPSGTGIYAINKTHDNKPILEMPKEHSGRFPANIIHDGSDEVVNGFPNTISSGGEFKASDYKEGNGNTPFTRGDFSGYDDSGSASRFFYTAKANKRDRDEGLDIAGMEEHSMTEIQGRKLGSAGAVMKNGKQNPYASSTTIKRNIHPTVKPTDLMAYLVRLITPKGGVVLDMFMGSGSTGKACVFENADRNADYKFIGIELMPEYLELSHARIEWAIKFIQEGYDEVVIDGKKELVKPISIFDFEFSNQQGGK